MLPHLFAYLDLASGSMIVQAAIAGVVTLPILLRGRIRRLLGRDGAVAEVVEQGAPGTAGRDMRLEAPIDRSETGRP